MVNSRQKGKRGELDLVKLLKKHGFEAQRGRQYKGSPDSPDVISNLPFHIECKFKERINVYEAYDKAAEESGEGPPVVFYRRNRREWLCIVGADDFLGLLDGA